MRKSLKIHIAKKDLGLSDDVYRVILGELFGEESAGKLSIKQLEALIKHFEKLNWPAWCSYATRSPRFWSRWRSSTCRFHRKKFTSISNG